MLLIRKKTIEEIKKTSAFYSLQASLLLQATREYRKDYLVKNGKPPSIFLEDEFVLENSDRIQQKALDDLIEVRRQGSPFKKLYEIFEKLCGFLN
jgi:hypothetical protein